MRKSHHAQPDLLVLGDQPCCHFAAALVRKLDPNLHVLRATLPHEQWDDRLVLVHPHFFDLHGDVGAMRKHLELTPIGGLKFLADDPATHSAHAIKDIAGYVGSFKQIHSAMSKLAAAAKVEALAPRAIAFDGLDESGIDLRLDGRRVRPRLLILGSELLDPQQKRMLGLPLAWENGVLHRYTYVKLKVAKRAEPASRPLVPMSLDLNGALHWAWLLSGKGMLQLAVSQPLESLAQTPPGNLLRHWCDVLEKHGELKSSERIDLQAARAVNLPLAGALAQEGVANRTLLIGPAGGFLTACAEEIYPTCWSALFAADVARRALKEKHVQDALQAYRYKWGATLGDFLRGPQQNLRFLMPLIYRNPMMTARLTEAILLGKSVVR